MEAAAVHLILSARYDNRIWILSTIRRVQGILSTILLQADHSRLALTLNCQVI